MISLLRRLAPIVGAFVLFSLRIHAQAIGHDTFYVSIDGDDSYSGLSALFPWRTIDRLNQQNLCPGDFVYFEGGRTFEGTVVVSLGEGGTPDEPVTFTTYGPGKATISAGSGSGFDVRDVAGIRISDLVIAGSGADTNNGIGVNFYTELPGDVKLPWIRIENCRITGFRQGGISIGAWNGRTGFQDVRVVDCLIDHNGNNGMAVWGYSDFTWGQTLADYAHRGIYVGHNTFESNWGDPLRTNKHTGSGVEVAQAAIVTIEYNVAFDNGRNNTWTGGGPVGIWMWDCFLGAIQYNESHHNQSGTIDGGGFDLDGGCASCVMQYNYSHDNDGPGFMIAQFPGARPMRNVTVRYNISERDGGKGASGALTLWNGDPPLKPIQNALFHNNTVFVDAKPVGIPRGFRAFGSTVVNSGFANNIFFSKAIPSWIGEAAMPTCLWAGNLYYNEGGNFVIRQGGVTYNSLNAWRLASGQEMLLGLPTGLQTNPGLIAPGNGGTLGSAELLHTLSAYRLQGSSVARDLGIDLLSFGIPMGTRDFFGATVPVGAGFSIGADEGP